METKLVTDVTFISLYWKPGLTASHPVSNTVLTLKVLTYAQSPATAATVRVRLAKHITGSPICHIFEYL